MFVQSLFLSFLLSFCSFFFVSVLFALDSVSPADKATEKGVNREWEIETVKMLSRMVGIGVDDGWNYGW